MKTHSSPEIAVLLATYNGARFVQAQIESYTKNTTPFALHWLDDHSTDNTREVVRSAARAAGVELFEWHQSKRLGYPGVYFELIDRVDADIYFFSDQDDIWQEGKIDVSVAHVLPEITSPLLCFSDPLLFYDEEPEVLYAYSDINHVKAPAVLRSSRSLLTVVVLGQSMTITRPLREMYLRHKDIARNYAAGHDWWFYLLAVTAGKARMLADAPTTLWRQHDSNVSGELFRRDRTLASQITSKWRLQRLLRQAMSRLAQGFLHAASTLPPGPVLDELLALAPLVAGIDRKQSPATLARLLLRRAMAPSWRHQFWLSLSCLFSDANTPEGARLL